MTDIDTDGLDEKLTELVETAEATLHDNFSDQHRTAAAVRTADGNYHVGLHLDTTISSESIHAEATAVASAVLESDEEGPQITAVVAVSKQSADDEAVVIPPCGSCRELLADYATDAQILVPGGDGAATDGPRVRPLAELLPSDVTEITDHPRFD